MRDIKGINRFNVIRYALIAIVVCGLFGFYLFKYVKKDYQYLSIIYLLCVVIIVWVMISIFYRCPYCKAVPRGHPIPYVDLAPKKCSNCGRSLRVNDSGGGGEGY